ncbi:MAG: nucleotidyltransferase domain-containing protein [Spirochaetes bacterium]|nr:nucleotidyltransferase domain-containing protein [Spirochaetota bacterium]
MAALRRAKVGAAPAGAGSLQGRGRPLAGSYLPVYPFYGAFMGGSFDIAAAAESFMARQGKVRERRRRLHEMACADSARIVDMAIREFQPRRILQWGSLLEPDDFDEHSDIDIAVEGLADARGFLDLLGKAIDMTEFPVDLVEWEKLDQDSRESILRRARVVYEREG